jgi:hypothetical protein
MHSDHDVSERNSVILLERLWLTSGERLAGRCRGLTDEELLWEPVEDSWNLVPDAAHPVTSRHVVCELVAVERGVVM